VVVLAIAMLGLVPNIADAAPLACGDTLMANRTLHADLDCSGMTSGTAITFGKGGLTLDLNGHTIKGPYGYDSAHGIDSEYNHNIIKNGTLQFFDTSVYLYNASQNRILNVKLVGDDYCCAEGFYLYYGVGNVLRNNKTSDVYYGFDLEYTAGSRVVNNVALRSDYSFYMTDTVNDLYKNNVSNGVSGDTYGFYDSEYSSGTRFINNVANGGYDGFYLACDAYASSLLLDGNVSKFNDDYGFYIYECYNSENYAQKPNVIRNNVARNNGSDGFYDYYSIASTYENNKSIGNDGDGFYFDYPTGYVITNNIANANSSDGFYIYDNYSYDNAKKFANNVANNNASYGFDAEEGVPGFGNSATGNGDTNCYNVVCG